MVILTRQVINCLAGIGRLADRGVRVRELFMEISSACATSDSLGKFYFSSDFDGVASI